MYFLLEANLICYYSLQLQEPRAPDGNDMLNTSVQPDNAPKYLK